MPKTRIRKDESLRVEYVALRQLKTFPGNPKTHVDISPSLDRFGYTVPILVDDDSGRIVAGHGRVEALEKLRDAGNPPPKRVRKGNGDWLVPVLRGVGFGSEEEAAAYLLADNRYVELGGWDDTELLKMLEGISSVGEDALLGIGFDEKVLESIKISEHRRHVSELDISDPPSPPKNPVTKSGDVWILGNHILVCGDCTDVKSYRGKKFNLGLTDPPYGVGVDYDGREDSEEALRDLSVRFFRTVRPICDALVFSPGVTRQWYYPEPDWVLCWFYGGGPHRSPWGFNCWQPFLAYGNDPSLKFGQGCRPDAVDSNIASHASSIDHPCPKPLALWKWLFERLTFGPQVSVVDPFCGSGTTLLVGEEFDAHCYGVEISPAYCDVIVERWEESSGKKALRKKKTRSLR